MKLQEVLAYTPERYSYYTSLIGKTTYRTYAADSGSNRKAYVEDVKVISVEMYGNKYFEVTYET